MFWVGSVAGRGQIDITCVLPFSVEVKVYLLLSRRGVTLCVLCCIRGCPSRGLCMFGSLVVSFYSVGKKMCKWSTNYLWNNGNVQGVLCNGTYIWEHIILFLVLGSFRCGTYVEKCVLSMGANMLTPPSCCGVFSSGCFS
jgi:hypothetical protein